MYKSPIELLVTDIQNQIMKQQDEEIYQAVLHYIPYVDKDELIRALRYDREQYEKGYADGKRDAVKYGLWTPLQINGHAFGVTCSECNTTWDDKSNYCPNCGAKMDGERRTEDG